MMKKLHVFDAESKIFQFNFFFQCQRSLYPSLWEGILFFIYLSQFTNLFRIYTHVLLKIAKHFNIWVYHLILHASLNEPFLSYFYEACNVKNIIHNSLTQQIISYLFKNSCTHPRLVQELWTRVKWLASLICRIYIPTIVFSKILFILYFVFISYR